MPLFLITGALTLLTALTVACGGGNEGGGTIDISGSSTVEPISVRVAELFEDVSPKVRINIDGPGTGDGFKLFCDGETDISNASRAIKTSEAKTCQQNGVRWIELKVAIDGIAVMTADNNNAIDCVSYEQLYALIGPESTGFNNWADGNQIAMALGDNTTLPSANLKIFGPGEESGTFDSFVELVIEHLAAQRGEQATTRPDYSASADDNVILRGISNSNSAIGWLGFAFADGARGVKLLDIDGGNGCTSPSADAISSGDYPIARPLYIYVNANKAEANPAIGAYIDFYLSNNGLQTAVSDVGYVNLGIADQSATRSNWQQKKIGG